MVANEAYEYRFVIWIFFWFIVADLVDFVLMYNTQWFYIGEFPVTLNVVTALVFGGVILKEIVWEKRAIL